MGFFFFFKRSFEENVAGVLSTVSRLFASPHRAEKETEYWNKQNIIHLPRGRKIRTPNTNRLGFGFTSSIQEGFWWAGQSIYNLGSAQV